MKANEFVKKFGIIKASKVVVGHPKAVAYKFYNYDFEKEGGKYDEVCLVDLKRLVESHELVAIHGFEKSKEIVTNAPSDDHFYSWTLGGSGVRDKTVNIGELRKAIADVESCQ